MKHEYKNLMIWNKGRALRLAIYKLAESFPSHENYNLTSQINRSALSIPANIAEGSAYDSDTMFIKYLSIALGSLVETESHLYLAFDVKYINDSQLNELLVSTDELKRMIIGFINKLKNKK